jgi:hypothetical protein
MTATATKQNSEGFLVLILTDCGQAIVKPPALQEDIYYDEV